MKFYNYFKERGRSINGKNLIENKLQNKKKTKIKNEIDKNECLSSFCS